MNHCFASCKSYQQRNVYIIMYTYVSWPLGTMKIFVIALHRWDAIEIRCGV